MGKNIEQIFAMGKNTFTFRRINSTHPSDLYLGYNEDGQKALVIVENSNESKIQSSQIIHAQLYLREDGKTSLEFVLKDNKFEVMFYRLCEDIINSTVNVKKYKAISFVIDRWNAWKTAFQQLNYERLSDISIMGLIGELVFMNEYMIPKYGIDRSITAWEGPNGGHKDYVIDSTWYEIKSTTLSNDIIKINSIQQLDSDKVGFLQIVRLETTNKENNDAVNLNLLVEKIRNKITSNSTLKKYIDKLVNINYVADNYYDDKCFMLEDIEKYIVNSDFPCIRRRDLPLAINSVQYELKINVLKRG